MLSVILDSWPRLSINEIPLTVLIILARLKNIVAGGNGHLWALAVAFIPPGQLNRPT